ncbi:hypothetical protein ACP70R_044740 [Stipagrostis hirtigluma subsp. patula]
MESSPRSLAGDGRRRRCHHRIQPLFSLPTPRMRKPFRLFSHLSEFMVPYAEDPKELAIVMQGFKLTADGTMYYDGGETCSFTSKASGADYINKLIGNMKEARLK